MKQSTDCPFFQIIFSRMFMKKIKTVPLSDQMAYSMFQALGDRESVSL
jgi:hypothetical protein